MAELNQLPPEFLVCGSKIQLMALGTTRAKWATVFIGARLGRYLAVAMPKVAGGAPMKLNEGTQWLITFINRGLVYSFQSHVLGYSYRMEPTLFLEYPTNISVSNLRADKRYPVNIPLVFLVRQKVKFSSLGEENSVVVDEKLVLLPAEATSFILPSGQVKAVVADISENGFLLASPTPLAKEAVIESIFYLPGQEPLGNILAICRECRAKPGGYSAGLAYLSPSKPEVVARLNELINSIANSPLRI